MRLFELDHDAEPPRADKRDRVSMESEWQLESWLMANPEIIVDESLLIFGRQHGLPSGVPDLLALDRWGNSVVIEVKAGQSGTGSASEGSILSQPQEYAQSLSSMSYEDMEEVYRDFKRSCQDGSWEVEEGAVIEDTLQDAHESWFGRSIDTEDFNEHQRIVIVAEVITRQTEHNVRFLLEQGLLIQCVEVQLFGASERGDDDVLTSKTIVDYPLSRIQPEEKSVDYTSLLMQVRDRAYSELEVPLQLEQRDSIASPSSSRDLHFTSGHPAHPNPLVYRFEPRTVEEGHVKYKLCVFGAEEEQEPPIREFLKEQTQSLDGFEIRDTHASGMTIGEKTVEVTGEGDPAEMSKELVEVVLTVHEDAVERFDDHPAFAE